MAKPTRRQVTREQLVEAVRGNKDAILAYSDVLGRETAIELLGEVISARLERSQELVGQQD